MQVAANIGIPQLQEYLAGQNGGLLDYKEVACQHLAALLLRGEMEEMVLIVACCQGQILTPIKAEGWNCRCGQVHPLGKIRWVRKDREGYVRVGTKRTGLQETCPPMDEEWEFEIPSEPTAVSDM